VFALRRLFVNVRRCLLRSVMLRAAIIALLCLTAFDHYVGDDKGVLFIAAITRHLFQ
jgi:hypothetical protein